jgi:hypothetical protein
VQAIGSFINTQKDQPPPPKPHYDVNNNATIDYFLGYLAGGIGDHFGGFTNVAFEGVARHFRWDHFDLRAVNTGTLFGSDVTYGLSLNNDPSVQDVWQTLPVWSFPFRTSDLQPLPSTTPVLSGTFSQNVLGLSAYAWWDSNIYAEVALYRSLSAHFLKHLGIEPGSTNLIDGVAPYARVAYQQDFGDQNFEVGAFAFFPNVFPGRDQSAGKTDGYTDAGIDASYQYLGNNDNIFTANARYTHENRELAASVALGNASNASGTLDEFVINGSYYWHNLAGLTVQHFQTWGNTDPLFNASNRTFKPNSAGWIFQLDTAPFRDKEDFPTRINLRIGLQYFAFSEFNGASQNFDGFGRNASDNNTLRLFLWTAF